MVDEAGSLDEPRGFSTLLPPYGYVARLLPILDDVHRDQLKNLISTVMSLTGTPQETLDWSEPDRWIPERLPQDLTDLALRIWQSTEGKVNPRYIRGHYYFLTRHHLLDVNWQGRFEMSSRTSSFIRGDESLIHEIDQLEGIQFLLQSIAALESPRVSELRAHWAEWIINRSNYRADSAIKSLLRYRLRNMELRGLIERNNSLISLTDLGQAYARQAPDDGFEEQNARQRLMQAIQQYNKAEREQLRMQLINMEPYSFEFLVRDLLDEMGYSEVTVTAQGGDQGVDVVARVEFGITTITEFVQVKRRTRTLGRAVLDQLRGALPYHGAIRGTLITLGAFSKGCEDAAIFPGAQPITLIDGERLLDLLIKHQVAMRSRPIDIHEVDDRYFTIAKQEDLIDDLA